MSAMAHLDREILDELRMIMGNEFGGLLNTFLQDSAQRVATLQGELAKRSDTGLRGAAHSFKGSSSNMGARQLAQLCKQIEECALAGDIDACTPLVSALVAEFEAVRSEVDALLG